MKPKRKKTGADRSIEFRLENLSARDVSIVGDFNQWEPKAHPMRQDESGVWTQNRYAVAWPLRVSHLCRRALVERPQ